MRFKPSLLGLLALWAGLLPGGCVLAPRDTPAEQARMQQAGQTYEPPLSQRVIPDLPADPQWQDVLRRAFLTNGDLESAFFEWKAALARIPQAAGWPNTNLAPNFSYLFSSGKMKSFDRTTVNAGFDSMQDLSFPTKTMAAGKIALEDAKAAGSRFEAAKFDLQRRVLGGWLDLALLDEKLRIQRDNVSLLKLLSDTAANRVNAGGAQQDLLRAETDYRLAENDLANMQSERRSVQAMLNALIARAPEASLVLHAALPAARPIPVDDARLIAIAVDNNPGLAELSRQVAGRDDAVELARMAWIPDINPFAGFTGTLSQTLGATLVLPTTIPQIQGRIEETRAMLRAAQAQLRQARLDRAAEFVAALYVLRNAERQTTIFTQTILPGAQQALASARDAYATGAGSFSDLIETQRTLLDVRLMIAETRIEREKRLAELEALAGLDIETLEPLAPTTTPTSGETKP